MLITIVIIVLINVTQNKKKEVFYRCGEDDSLNYNIIEIDLKPIDHNSPSYRRRLKEVDEDGFKKFNIYVDMANPKKEIELYEIQNYSDIFINSINKAVETLETLLKVKSLEIDFNLEDDDFDYFGIKYWDKEKFGTEAMNKGINFFSLDIDLVIFVAFEELEERILASSYPAIMNTRNGQPIVGILYINKNLVYPLENVQEYFQSVIIHEFTHILGFSSSHFFFYLDILTVKEDIYYINSQKVLEVAKKYFNCSDIDGIPLEDYEREGTISAHWEARILLGEYMNAIIYPEEQVISEFTLALLEDTGYYKANYYTGGLMRYGKNKGCDFIKNKCVNSSSQINPYFENEFFDSIHSDYGIDNSCSSGRLSRPYNSFWVREFYYNNTNYFQNESIGGWPSADFCPVSEITYEEMMNNSYLGHCSNKGSGEYGAYIQINKDPTYNTSAQMKLITGEMNSDHSFCYLSSLISKEKDNFHYYSNTVRAVCFETFCSSKSLTVKINNDYIVCPREGGKIEIKEYDGYLLCPDYNLICSGTVLCNNMFDCVDKRSEVKEESYLYDYKIKTSQNIDRAEDENANHETNYELSNDGKCPQYCCLCNENKKCNKCKEGYFRVNKEDSIICLSENELKEGYYLDNSIYYECIENCKTCSNKTICEECKFGFTNNENKCIGKIENCKEYKDVNSCKKCKNDFAFKGDERNKCTNLTELEDYYSKDEGISYILCDGNDKEYIQNCKKCNYYNKNLECKECKNEYILLDEEKNKCYSKNTINDNNKEYYFANNTHARTCSKEIKNCNICENENKCLKCEEDFYLLNDITNKCYNISEITPIEEYYLGEDNLTYYSCKNIKFNSFANCRNCTGNNTCSLCNNNYYFVNGNKTQCINLYSLEEGIYQIDPNDTSNMVKCSEIDQNCHKCSFYGECYQCFENSGIFSQSSKCILFKDYYDIDKDLIMYLLGVENWYNYFLDLYVFMDYELPYNFYLIVPIIINISNYSFRNLQESEKIFINFYYYYYNKTEKIAYFDGHLTDYLESIDNLTIDFNNITDSRNNSFKYTINNSYTVYYDYEYTGGFYLDNVTKSIYEVKGIATKGNNFTLILNEDINLEEKEINIQFIETENRSNIIESKCILAKENDNKIPCSVDIKTNKNLIMKDFFYLNKEDKELISINIKKPSKNHLIIEPQTSIENPPSNSIIEPSNSDNKPSSSDYKPSSSDNKPSSSDNKPSSSDNKPSSSDIKPSSSDIKPSSTDITPSSSDIKPSSSDITPSSSDNKTSIKIPIIKSSDNKISGGTIAIIVLCSLILVTLITLITLLIFKRKGKIEPKNVSEINMTDNSLHINNTLNSKIDNKN